MRLVDDNQVPLGLPDVGFLRASELVGAQDDRLLLERVEVGRLDRVVERLRLHDHGRQVELVGQLLARLFPEVGRENHEQAALPLRPLLREQQTCLDCLAQPYLVGKYRALRERALERKERRLDLMWIEIDLGVRQHCRQLLDAVGWTALCQLLGEVPGVEGRRHGCSPRMPPIVGDRESKVRGFEIGVQPRRTALARRTRTSS